MNIIHIIFSFNAGGAETMLVDIINEQCKYANINIIIVNKLYSNELLSHINKKVNIYKIDRKSGSRNIFPIIKLNYLIFRLKPTFIHCHDYELINILLRNINKYKIGLTIHSLGIPIKILYKYDKIFVISETVRNDIENRSKLKTYVILNGIKFDSINVKKTYKDNSKDFKIIQVSRLDHERKGQDILIDAINVIIKENRIKKLSVDFIGEGESEIHLKYLVNKYNLGKFINFLGYKSREYIYKNLCKYDLLVQPSRTEGFGLTVVEAIAAKIPVLVSDNCGPMEIISNGKYGWSFQQDNEYDCAKKIYEILMIENNIVVKEKINIAYKEAKEIYNVKNTAKVYLKFY